MAIMAMDTTLKFKRFCISVFLLAPCLSFAKQGDFETYLKINETYTDNVNYVSENANSSFVNQTSLGIKTDYQSENSSYNLDGQLINAIYSHDGDLDEIFVTLLGNVSYQLWHGLSLIGSASVQNVPRNTINNLYTDIIAGNTTQVENYSGGLAYNVNNSFYKLNSNLLYNTFRSDDGIGENNGYTALLNTRNGTRSKVVFWDINNSFRKTNNNNITGEQYRSEFKLGYITPYKFNPFIRYYDEDNSGSINPAVNAESNSFGAGFRWLVLPRLTLDLSYNIPINNDELNDYYDVNVNWQPNQRTKLNAGISQRFFGDSYNFSLSHRSRRLTNTISYTESIQTFTRENVSILFGGELCSLTNSGFSCITVLNGGQQNEPIFIITEDDSFSLNKALNITSRLVLRRTTFTLNINANSRENVSDNFKTFRNVIELNASRRVTPLTTVDVTARYTQDDFFVDLPEERKNIYKFYKVSMNKKLNRTLSFDISLSHLDRTSDPKEFLFKENRISLELKKVL